MDRAPPGSRRAGFASPPATEPDQISFPLRSQGASRVWSSLARPRIPPGVRSSTCDDAARRRPSSFPCDRPQAGRSTACSVARGLPGTRVGETSDGTTENDDIEDADRASRRLRFAGFAAWRFLEPFYESSDLLGAWRHTDPTLRKGIARGRDDWGVQLRAGNRLVSDITQVILQFCRDPATDCVTCLYRMQPPASL